MHTPDLAATRVRARCGVFHTACGCRLFCHTRRVRFGGAIHIPSGQAPIYREVLASCSKPPYSRPTLHPPPTNGQMVTKLQAPLRNTAHRIKERCPS